MRQSLVAAAIAALSMALMLGCGSTSVTPATKTAAEPDKTVSEAPQIITAKSAFWPMYKAARSWAPDVVLVRLTAKTVPGYTNQAGKAGMWEAVFGSPTLHQYRIFTYSIVAVPPGIFKGVYGGVAAPWGGETRDAMAIDLAQFNVDSDTAYQTGAGVATDWLKKNPGKDLASLEVGQTYRFQGPVWYLLWGDKKSGYNALVDANSAKLLSRK